MKPFRFLAATYKYRKWLSNGITGLLLILAGVVTFVYGTEIESFRLIFDFYTCVYCSRPLYFEI